MDFNKYYQSEIAPIIPDLYKEARKGKQKSLIFKVFVLLIAAGIIMLNLKFNFMTNFWYWFAFGLVFIVLFIAVSTIPANIKNRITQQ